MKFVTIQIINIIAFIIKLKLVFNNDNENDSNILVRKLEEPISNKIYLFYNDIGNNILFTNVDSLFENCIVKLIKENEEPIDIKEDLYYNTIDKTILYDIREAPTKIMLEFTKNPISLENLFIETKVSKIIFDENFNSKNIINLNRTFAGCSLLTSIDLSHFNSENVETMDETFCRCTSLLELDLSSFKTNKLTNMRSMVNECSSLKSIDLSMFNTTLVTDMQGLFYKSNSLISINLSSFDTKKINTMNAMFSGCENLISLDISTFDASSCKDFDYMFEFCNKLTSIKFANFNENTKEMIKITTFLESIYFNTLNSINLTLTNDIFESYNILKNIYINNKIMDFFNLDATEDVEKSLQLEASKAIMMILLKIIQNVTWY